MVTEKGIKAKSILMQPVDIAPLAAFRVIFGLCMVISTIRFMWLGWIDDHYLQPLFHFKYYGFSWVDAGGPVWQYSVHILLLISALMVMLGYYYRIASIALFVLFTYTELIDLTYYLNHYYYVSLVCMLLIFLPANRYFSIDVLRKPALKLEQVPRWCVAVLMLQIGIVYFYAGLAKINHEWLINAMPLKIWLPASYDMSVLGPLFSWKYTPYLFSWFGMLYDCTIVFWLLWPKSRLIAYASVIFFHSVTGLLFQIGVFPLVMIGGTMIFFSAEWHRRWMTKISSLFSIIRSPNAINIKPFRTNPLGSYILIAYFTFHILFPWRYLLYDGNIFWTEEGYRFSWRVMLMEKAGTATFFVKDSRTGKEGEVFNRDFLNQHQEKQMAMQPDMILQFARFLAEYYESKGVHKPEVRAEVYVTLNGKPSRLLIDPELNLAQLEDGLIQKNWILSYEQTLTAER